VYCGITCDLAARAAQHGARFDPLQAVRWRQSEHYLLCFKDRMFEAIAQEMRVVGSFATQVEALEHAISELSVRRLRREGEPS
jgi:predicted GIY-YIG superfamily endonuclease